MNLSRRPAVAAAALMLLALMASAPALAVAPPPPPEDLSGGGITDTSIGAEAVNVTEGVAQAPSGATSKASRVTRVQAPLPACRYYPDRTGPEMAAWASTWRVPMWPVPPTNWQEHATDLEGRWYRPDCIWTDRPLSQADLLNTERYEFQGANTFRWSSTAPPPPAVPVVDLVELARDNQSLPVPIVELNPKGRTVTGLRTWVWPSAGEMEPVIARAESGPNWAQVTATPGKLTLSARNAEVGPCDAPLVWSAGQADDATDCYVTFRRSSAGMPGGKATIDVGVIWQVELTTSDGVGNGPIGTVVRSGQVAVGVAEVQSVLR